MSKMFRVMNDRINVESNTDYVNNSVTAICSVGDVLNQANVRSRPLKCSVAFYPLISEKFYFCYTALGEKIRTEKGEIMTNDRKCEQSFSTNWWKQRAH